MEAARQLYIVYNYFEVYSVYLTLEHALAAARILRPRSGLGVVSDDDLVHKNFWASEDVYVVPVKEGEAFGEMVGANHRETQDVLVADLPRTRDAAV